MPVLGNGAQPEYDTSSWDGALFEYDASSWDGAQYESLLLI